MTRQEITASTQWPLARRIVLQALQVLLPGQNASTALLSERPLNSGQIYTILVQSVFEEYAGFFLRGEEALKEKVPLPAHPPPTPTGAPADTIDNYRALNLLLAPDDQHRFYPQITFEDFKIY
ncbi:hypothetical protein BGX34_007132, partial [Mortierella sp. NVP85]